MIQMNRPKFQEIKEYEDPSERDQLEDKADLYSIIRTMNSLEIAFSRDAVSINEYNELCTRLISQYKTTEQALVNSGAIENGDSFFKMYASSYQRAYERLVRTGVPATVMHATHDDKPDTVIVAQTTQAYITSMDALKLDQRAVDQIQPLIKELTGSLNRINGIPPDFDGLIKMKLWLTKLHQMKASDELEEDEARQLLFDLESTYGSFMDVLSNNGKNKKK